MTIVTNSHRTVTQSDHAGQMAPREPCTEYNALASGAADCTLAKPPLLRSVALALRAAFLSCDGECFAAWSFSDWRTFTSLWPG